MMLCVLLKKILLVWNKYRQFFYALMYRTQSENLVLVVFILFIRYFHKWLVCILLCDMKSNSNNILSAIRMRSFTDCVQRNLFNPNTKTLSPCKPDTLKLTL